MPVMDAIGGIPGMVLGIVDGMPGMPGITPGLLCGSHMLISISYKHL
jgi:hypothetical protein